MTHYDNSGSEDGQLRSPGDTHFLSSGQKSTSKTDLLEDDTDSLDIKPPQATIHRDSKRRSGKEKKHSKERKHKSDHRGGGGGGGGGDPRDDRRDRGLDKTDNMSNKYRGEREMMVDDRRYMKYYERGRPVSHGQQRRDHHYDRGTLGDEYEYQNRHKHREMYHQHHQHYQQQPHQPPHQRYDYHSQRNYMEPPPQYDTRPDAEMLEQDLRTRLLTKRHKYVKESSGPHNHHEKRSSYEYHRSERATEVPTEKRKAAVIEVIDSPEQQEVFRRKHKKKDKEREKEKEKLSTRSVVDDDPELVARKAKLLDAEREMAKRKEVAREELEARREQLRRVDESNAEKPGHKRYQTEEERASKRKKRKMYAQKMAADGGGFSDNFDVHSHNEDDDDDDDMDDSDKDDSDGSSNKSEKKKKRRRRTKENADVYSHHEDEDDDDDDDDEEDDDDDDDDSDSDSSADDSDDHSQKSYNGAAEKSKKKKKKISLSEEEGILPDESPLSIGDLSKSPHKRKAHSSRSRSNSNPSSRSKSDSDLERDDDRRSTTRSRSRTRSRSPLSHSRSRSRSRSISGSSRSRSHSRSRSRSRSRSKSKSQSRSRSRSEERNMKSSAEEEARKGAVQVDLDEEDVPRNDKGEKLPNYFPGIQGCRSVEEFQCLNRIEEGTYGVVYRAKDKRTSEIVALKRLKMEKEKEGFPITSLREINTLLKGQHPNIVTVREIVVGSNMDRIFIVMDYVEHDLKSLMETMKHKEQSFFPGEVKCLVQQLLCAVNHLHDNWILHRDLKTSNLLLSHKGILKVGDFGLAREYGSPLKKYTSLVVTLWYRAPELLLCSPEYSTPIDIWSVGCIFAEFLQMQPLFPGKSEIDQLNRIFKELGTPNEKIWPGYKDLPAVKNLLSQNSQFTEYPVSNLRKRFMKRTTETGISLLQGLLTYDPKQRLTAEQALNHPYFKELPVPIDPSMFPTWPAKSELGARKALASSPKPPSGGSQFKQLGHDDIITTKSSGVISGSKKTSLPSSSSTGFVLNAGIDQRQLAMGPGFSLKF